jgi:hypothetical protein
VSFSLNLENSDFMSKFNDRAERIKHVFNNYSQIIEKKKLTLKNATQISADEINEKIEEVSNNPKPLQLISLLKTLTHSGLWISSSSMQYLASIVDLNGPLKHKRETDRVEKILTHVANGAPLPLDQVSYSEIFKNIYNEVEFSHHNPAYQSVLKLPKSKVTMVLVSGVLNEIFSTPAFERGAKHLAAECGIKFLAGDVSGTKGSKSNSEALEKQLTGYIQKNPEEKLWILAFSKGGIDTLLYLKHNKEFADKHIVGLSTIASPILGSSHTDHKLLQFINKIHKFEDNVIYKYFEKEQNFLFKQVFRSISEEHQSPWFERNHHSLPKNLFYTSTAFESSWYESHFWMILTKIFFRSKEINDGVVEAWQAMFPPYFKALNLGVIKGHHLVGTRSSKYCQEALLEAHIVFLNYLGKIKS